jgi:pilus biogenesis lipoprotein CpaD
MAIIKKWSVLLLGVYALSACNYPAPKTAQVKTVVVSHDFTYMAGAPVLTIKETKSLEIFMEPIHGSAVSSAQIQVNTHDRRLPERINNIVGYLREKGVDSKNIYTTRDDDAVPPNTITLMLIYSVAVPPEPCPDWSKNATANYENTNSSNFGCAYNNNWVVQLSNPEDYNGNNSRNVSDATRDGVALQKYFSGSSSSSSGSSAASSTSSSSAAPSSP